MEETEVYPEQAEESFNNHVDNIPDGDIPLLPDETNKEIAAFNMKEAQDILEAAGITPENPNYKKYLGLTEANVHTWRRFSTYDESVTNMLIETLSDPEMTIEQYEKTTKSFRVEQIELQQKEAFGNTHRVADESYSTLMKNSKQSIRSGNDMRNALDTQFPEVFYEEGSSLPNRRVIAVIEDESAYGVVDAYAAKHSTNGLKLVVEVDNEGKEFVKITDAQGTSHQPGSFFNSRINALDNFLGKSELDFTDTELFSCLEKGDYDGFMELRKTRGQGGNKTNLAMRNLLNQREDLFNEVCEVYRNAGSDPEKFMQGIQKLKERYAHNVEVIAAETNYNALAKPKGKIDRVMFSARPTDLAQQSTFQNWKSCMNAAGSNHQYVKNTIGRGSIIAYGYNSENPSHYVSRILINPYTNENGEVLYHANRKTYGTANDAFRRTVEGTVEQEFNKNAPPGIYRLNPLPEEVGKLYPGLYGLYTEEQLELNPELYQLYPDDERLMIAHGNLEDGRTIRFVSGEMVDIDLPPNSKVTVEGWVKFKDVKKWPKDINFSACEQVWFYDCNLPNGLDLRSCERISLENTTFPEDIKINKCKNLNISNCVIPENFNFGQIESISLDNVNIPADIQLSKCKNLNISNCVIPENLNFSRIENVSLNNVNLPANMQLNKCKRLNISNCVIPENFNFSKMETITLNKVEIPSGTLFKDCKFIDIGISERMANGVSFENCETIMMHGNGEIPRDIQFKNCKKVSVINCSIPENFNFGTCSEVVLRDVEIPSGIDFSQCENIIFENIQNIPEDVKLPLREIKIAGNCSKAVQDRILQHNAAVAESKTSSRMARAARNLNARYDKWFDKNVGKAAEYLNRVAPNAVKKFDQITAKPIEWTGEQFSKAANSFAKTKSGKAIMKAMKKKGITKTIMKAGGKSAAKKIPLVCLGIACYFAYDRLKDGDIIGGVGEFTSGLVANVPIIGTAASLGIDGALLAHDLEESGIPVLTKEEAEMLQNRLNAIRTEELTDFNVTPRDAIYNNPDVPKDATYYMNSSSNLATNTSANIGTANNADGSDNFIPYVKHIRVNGENMLFMELPKFFVSPDKGVRQEEGTTDESDEGVRQGEGTRYAQGERVSVGYSFRMGAKTLRKNLSDLENGAVIIPPLEDNYEGIIPEEERNIISESRENGDNYIDNHMLQQEQNQQTSNEQKYIYFNNGTNLGQGR